MEVVFDQEYNYTPPKIRFMTIPFHPNIDVESGELSLDLIYGDGWDPQTDLLALFVTIKVKAN